MIALVALGVAHATEPAELRNTGPWFLGGEFFSSVLVGFVVPYLVTDPPADPTCEANHAGDDGFWRRSGLEAATAAHAPRVRCDWARR